MNFRSTCGFTFTMIAAVILAGCDAKKSAPAGPGPADSSAAKEFTQTPSGLKYRILRQTDGRKPTASSLVKAHYKGWLDDGTEFDNSYTKGKGPIAFPLNRVVPGWTEGLQLIGEGGMIELEIPSELGYGARGAAPVIPPNSTLHFIVELDSVRQ